MPDLPADRPEPPEHRQEDLAKSRGTGQIDRRTFLKGGLLAGGLLATGGVAAAELLKGAGKGSPVVPPATSQVAAGTRPIRHHTHQDRSAPRQHAHQDRSAVGPPQPSPGSARQPVRPGPGRSSTPRPNVLVLMVDQMRTSPHWMAGAPVAPKSLPNLTKLSRGAVCFGSHYTASNDCTPARATLLTGLYTHQTGCMITGGSTLAPSFPTWGTMMREQGYRTWWYGKWHLTHGDNRWSERRDSQALEPYGFAGGTYPSPDGAPGQGSLVDPLIADQFEEWFDYESAAGPWCTTVSFVNPHDIAWWYKWTNRVPAEWYAPSATQRLPPNFETPELLLARGKPRLQRSLQDTAAASFGPIPFSGPYVAEAWLPFLDLYMKLQRSVDQQIGRVLSKLESTPEVAANTVIVFTSDHGEYGSSHGLRGKGAGVYEEAIRVPLIVKDPRRILTRAPRRIRRQLTSSVDVAPLLLTIASGSDDWRRDSHYEHLATRTDMAAILRDPHARGRPYVLHATDEIVTEYAIETYASNAPLHVTAIRTHKAKFASYADWRPGAIVALSKGQENELYDLRTNEGRLEIQNVAGSSDLEGAMRAMLDRAVREELNRPLPARLAAARARGFEDYYSTATEAALKSVKIRRRRAEHERRSGGWSPFEEFDRHSRMGMKRVRDSPFARMERRLEKRLGGDQVM